MMAFCVVVLAAFERWVTVGDREASPEISETLKVLTSNFPRFEEHVTSNNSYGELVYTSCFNGQKRPIGISLS